MKRQLRRATKEYAGDDATEYTREDARDDTIDGTRDDTRDDTREDARKDSREDAIVDVREDAREDTSYDINLIQCDKCQNTFMNDMELREHIYEKHPAPRITQDFGNYNINDDGDITFDDDDQFEEYIPEEEDHQEGNNKLNCEECSMTYSTEFNLECHIMRNHIGKIKCPECNKRAD